MDSRWWVQLLVVGVGGFVGAVARHGLSSVTHRAVGHDYPAGTLLVNALGCLLIGVVLYFALERGQVSDTAKLLIVTGFLGSLTTFSTFGHETLDLLRQGRSWVAMTNVAANVVIGLIAVAAGWSAGARLAPAHKPDHVVRGVAFMNQAPATEVFEQRRVRVGATEYPYRVFVPMGEKPADGWPCIVFLHGRGECGSDNAKQLVHSLPMEVAKNPEGWPFVIIAPQKPDYDSQWEDHAKAVKKMLELSAESGEIDPDRVALTGLSQGGHGTWAIAARYPGMFRALMPVCAYVNGPRPGVDGAERWGKSFDGGTEMAQAVVETCVDLPIKIVHGSADPAVPPSESEGMARLLSRAGGQPELTIYEGVGHNAWERAYSAPGLADWFAAVTAPIEEPEDGEE